MKNLITLLLIDKLSGDLRRSLARDHRKTTWTLDDFLTTLRRELQVMEQDKPKEVNFLTNYNPSREQPSAPTKHKTQQHNTKLDTQRKTTQDKRNQTQKCSFCGSSHRASDCLK